MTSTPRIDLDRLVARVVLDISLLQWFATPQGRGPGCDRSGQVYVRSRP
jgi:hypothetical protein